jgi:hypothetical protein
VGGQRGFILFPKGRGRRGWNRVADKLCKVMVFLETTFGSSPDGVLSPVEKEDGKKDLGLKVSSSGCSGGAWLIVGGDLPSFAEVARLEASRSVKLWVPLVEMCELDLLPTMRPGDLEEARMALHCFVMEKKPLVKDVLLNPLGKEYPGSARKILPRLNLRTWRNLLVRILGSVRWVFVGSFVSV